MTERVTAAGKLRHFLTVGIWEFDPDSCTGLTCHLTRYLQFLLLVVRNFLRDNCLLRASALAFTTILSLVPFLALAFSILKGFGVQNQVEPLVLEQLSGGSQEVASRIINYINNTNMSSLGVFGLTTLLVTSIMLLDNIEEVFNVVWGVREKRGLGQKFSNYLSVVVSGPILIFTAISMTTFLETQSTLHWLVETSYLGDVLLYLFKFIPYFFIWTALTFLYMLIPNTTVRFRSALSGAILSGTCWQLAQWWYIHFQIGVAKYNAIYGTMAVLPIFMVWIYVSWLIVLFGVEVVHVHQNNKSLRREIRAGTISHRLCELLSLAILQHVVTAFINGRPGWTAEQLGESLDLPEKLLHELLTELVECGFLFAAAGEPPTYQPALAPDQMTVSRVLSALREFGGRWQPICLTEGEEGLARLLSGADEAVVERLAGLTLKDLAGEVKPDILRQLTKGGL